MPRKTKDEIGEIEEKTVKKPVKSKKNTAEKKLSKGSSSSNENTAQEVIENTVSSKEVPTKKNADKKTVAKKTNTKKAGTKKTDVKKAVTQGTTAKKKASTATSVKESSKKNTKSKKTNSTTKKSSVSSNTVKKSTATKNPSKDVIEKNKKTRKSKSPIEVLEYYDLPYRYNQTIVKILAQTPTTLFVYWDISDEDKEQYIRQYGEYFFNNTKPVLIIHNKTMNYSFEIDINDFANSWYLHINDSNCNYQVELGRRPINQYVNISNNYLHIVDSNDYVTQNDHILFDKLSHFVYFRNVKTNQTIVKNISNFALLQKIGKFDIRKFYEKLYPEEILRFEEFHLGNPSSFH